MQGGAAARISREWRLAFGRLALTAVLVCTVRSALGGNSGVNTLLLYEPVDANSVAIANLYQRLRDIPECNMVPYSFPKDQAGTASVDYRMTLAETMALIDDIRDTTAARELTNQIHCIVLAGLTPYLADPGYKQSLTAALFCGPSISSTSDIVSRFPDDYQSLGFVSRAYVEDSADVTELRSDKIFNGDRYWVCSSLGHMMPRGNNAEEIFSLLERAKACDGSFPDGTVYWPTNSDIRSTTREGQIAEVSNEFTARGVDYYVFAGTEPLDKTNAPGTFPVSDRAAIGCIAGRSSVNPVGSGTAYLPGSFADHLTSYAAAFEIGSQTKLSEWVRAGVCGTSGTVTEPYAWWQKFPHARLYAFLAKGASMGEAFWESVKNPRQQYLVSDPLAQPCADIPAVAITNLVDGEQVAGTLSILVEASSGVGLEADLDLAVDGRIVQIGAPGELVDASRTAGGFSLDTSSVPDGYHELRAIAYNNDSLRTQGYAIKGVVVTNSGMSLALSGPASLDRRALGSFTVTPAGLAGVSHITLEAGGRVLATLAAAGGQTNLAGTLFGYRGTNLLHAFANLSNETRVAAVPHVLEMDWTALAPTSGVATVASLAHVRYFADTTLPQFAWTNAPDLTGFSEESAFALSGGAASFPFVTDNNDSVGGHEFLALFDAPQTGVYDFMVNGYASVSLLIDDNELVSAFRGGADRIYATEKMEAGLHELRVRTVLNGSSSSFSVSVRGGAYKDFTVLGTADCVAPDLPVSMQIRFADTGSVGNEAAAGTIPVLLSTVATNTVTVDYARTGGTATPGADYTLAAGTLTFVTGQIAAAIPVSVTDDRVSEPDETIVVGLSSSVGAALHSPTVHTYVIRDDDAVFVAYNDFGWAAPQRTNRITRYSIGESGALLDYLGGTNLAAQLDVQGGSGPYADQGAGAAAGTDAYAVFNGIVDCTGLISYNADSNLTLTVSGLATNLDYEVVLFGNRANSDYLDRATDVTLSGADSFENLSTPGAAFSDPAASSVIITNGYNTVQGCVARFGRVRPGADGLFTLTVADGGSAEPPKYYLNALMLKATPMRWTFAGRKDVWAYDDTGTDLGSAWRAVAYDDSAWSNGPGILGYGEAYIDTELSYGELETNKHVTTYFRRTFVLDETPPTGSALALEANYDDGFVAYLNGTEAERASMPGGAVAYSTLADNHEGGAYETFDLSAQLDTLTAGTNCLAVELHQTGVDSSDLVMDLALVLQPPYEPDGARVTAAVGPGAAWRWRKGTAEASVPAGAWREPDFDDTVWPLGMSPLGYGQAGLGTTLNDMQDSYTSVFLRRAFSVENPLLVSGVRVWVQYDDGFVMWLNGEEIARVNMAGEPGDVLPCDALALTAGNMSEWSATLSGDDRPDLLEGPNLLAVQVFNTTKDSSDLYLDAELALLEGSFIPAAADGDRDGMHDDWEALYFGSLTNAAPGSDADDDGVPDAAEYIAGSDPTNAADYAAVDIEVSGNAVVVSFSALEATGTGYADCARYYSLEARTNLNDTVWSPVPNATNILGEGQPVAYTNSAAEGADFYRLRIWLE
ncbi:MAG: hypothetical protein JXR37_05005 [Kiritimatiellae bacterium]|nr:hypothetical protein [Kiritimatiellia bacterium]